MDQTILKILELDAATEERLSASKLQCEQKIAAARKQAAAMRQAQRHQTRDSIFEVEEQSRAECEQKIAELRGGFDRRTETMAAEFDARHDALLNALFEDTLHEAEA